MSHRICIYIKRIFSVKLTTQNLRSTGIYSARATLFLIRRHNESFAETLSYTFQYRKVIGYWVNLNYKVNKAIDCRISFQMVKVGSELGKCNRKSNTENCFYLFHIIVPRWSCANKLNQAFHIFSVSSSVPSVLQYKTSEFRLLHFPGAEYSQPTDSQIISCLAFLGFLNLLST